MSTNQVSESYRQMESRSMNTSETASKDDVISDLRAQLAAEQSRREKELADFRKAHDETIAKLHEWQDYWGCESPHDTHVQAGTTPDGFGRQLGIEQARANLATHRISELTARIALLEPQNNQLRDAAERAERELVLANASAHNWEVAFEGERRDKESAERVCAEAYQLAGAIGAPVAALDNLNAAANGLPIPHGTFLPVAPGDCDEVGAFAARLEEARREVDELEKQKLDYICQIAELSESYRTLEPCGHAKNFQIGDEHGNFTCTVCRIAELKRERDALLGNPEAVHIGAAYAIEALRQTRDSSEKIATAELALARMREAVAEIREQARSIWGRFKGGHGPERGNTYYEGQSDGLDAAATMIEVVLASLPASGLAEAVLPSCVHVGKETGSDEGGAPTGVVCAKCAAPLVMCPCVNDGEGSPDLECVRCSGSGWITDPSTGILAETLAMALNPGLAEAVRAVVEIYETSPYARDTPPVEFRQALNKLAEEWKDAS